METETITINPIEFIKNYIDPKIKENDDYELDISHIKYNKEVNQYYDYQIIRGITHDGLIMVTYDRIIDVLTPLLQKTSYCKANIPKDLKTIKDVKYTIGDIILESTFGMYNINGMQIHGQKDIITLPVKVEYILRL